MKSRKNFELSFRVVLAEMTALEADNAKLRAALDEQKRKSDALLQTAAAEVRLYREQLVTAHRQRKRADRVHDAALTQARARAAYYRTKLAEYRRELVATKSIVRKQKHD